MSDAFDDRTIGLTSPAVRADIVVPDNGVIFVQPTRALYVGQTGNVRVRTVGGDVVTFANMQGGVIYPVRVDQVLATGTTASDIIGLS